MAKKVNHPQALQKERKGVGDDFPVKLLLPKADRIRIRTAAAKVDLPLNAFAKRAVYELVERIERNGGS